MKTLEQLANSTKGLKKTKDGITASFDLLYLEPGYNVRDVNMNQVFSFSKSFLRGELIPRLTVQPIELNGKTVLKIIDGQHRYFGYKLAMRDKSFKSEGLDVVEFSGNLRDQIIHMVHANSGRNLTNLELAKAMLRLQEENETLDSISKLFNVSISTAANNIAVARFSKEHPDFDVLIDHNIVGMSVIASNITKHKERAYQRLCGMIGFESLDLAPIRNVPQMTDKMTEEEFEAKMTKYKSEIAKIKKQVAANMKQLKPKKVEKETVGNMSTLISDITLLIRNSKHKSNADGTVSIRLDGPMIKALYLAKADLDEVDSHNLNAIEIGKQLGMSEEELAEYQVVQKQAIAEAASKAPEATLPVDSSEELEEETGTQVTVDIVDEQPVDDFNQDPGGIDEFDAYDPNIDPLLDEEQSA